MIPHIDRLVQFPNRFKMTPVAGHPDVFDVDAQPGSIDRPGTLVTKAVLDEMLAASGVTQDGDTPDVFYLPQEGFALVDGYVARIKLHKSPVADMKLKIGSTDPKYLLSTMRAQIRTDLPAGTWIECIYNGQDWILVSDQQTAKATPTLVTEIITSDTTWVMPSKGVLDNKVRVRAFGGGGGSELSHLGSGGGGGHMADEWVTLEPGEQVICTIGAAGQNLEGGGTAGGTTSFGTHVAAPGGSPGSPLGGGNGGSGGGGGAAKSSADVSGRPGGHGSYGGGGGGGGCYGGAVTTARGGDGGNGGPYGGGGGTGGAYNAAVLGTPGLGGLYGGNGGVGAATPGSGTNTSDTTLFPDLDFRGTGAAGTPTTSGGVKAGGAGGGGFGGKGGNGQSAESSSNGGAGGGGGGGYGASGGIGDSTYSNSAACAGGGGGYGGAGMSSNSGGGGGGGYGASGYGRGGRGGNATYNQPAYPGVIVLTYYVSTVA